MRVQGTIFLLIVLSGIFWARQQQESNTANLHNQNEALGHIQVVQLVSTLSGQAMISPIQMEMRSEATQPSVLVALAVPEEKSVTPEVPEEEVTFVKMAVIATATIVPTPLPKVVGVSTGQGKTSVTFYYCQRTVNRNDDGGGYCGQTRSGVQVHPGSAACSYERTVENRRFTVEGDPHGLIYTCEDTGSAVVGDHIDLWFYTNTEGWEWPASRKATINWLD